MKTDYDYHIKVDGEVIFLGSTLEVTEKSKAARTGVLERIGPSGIYIQYPGLKNSTFINFKKIEKIKLISENS